MFLVAGEELGDALGAELIEALAVRLGGQADFVGVGGARMIAAGLNLVLPMAVDGVHGYSAVIARLPSLLLNIRKTAAAVVRVAPDVLVLIDAPAFNLRVGRIVRKSRPDITIVDYVSPTVWAYAPWRARRMAAYVDQVLAVLPFEPSVHRDLGGPPCTFVGHPLLERLDDLRPRPGERTELDEVRMPVLLILPGSRRSEIKRLMAPFGETLALVRERFGGVEAILPAVPAMAEEISERVGDWPVLPRIVVGEEAKLAAFRRAHAALAASGTVTLELALSGVPMVVAYRVEPLIRLLRPLLKVDSIVLANIVAEANVVPEFIGRDSDPERLCEALMPLLEDSRERRRQLAAFDRIEGLMAVSGGPPSRRAADVVVETVRRRRLHAALERA